MPWWLPLGELFTRRFWLGEPGHDFPGVLRDPTFGVRQAPGLAVVSGIGGAAAAVAVILAAKVALAVAANMAAKAAALAAAKAAAARWALIKTAAAALGIKGGWEALDVAGAFGRSAVRRWERSPFPAAAPMPLAMAPPMQFPQAVARPAPAGDLYTMWILGGTVQVPV